MLANVFKIEISASTVAWYGAIVATISVIVSLLNYLRDRSIIKLNYSEGLLVYAGKLGQTTQVIIEAVNKGRRPVTFNGVGFELKNNTHMLIPVPENLQLPYELHEGKSIRFYVKKEYLIAEAKKVNSEIKFAWYRSSTGKLFKKRIKVIQK